VNFKEFHPKPTLELLSIAILTGIVGAFIAYVAFLAIGVKTNPLVLVGFCLIVYSVYTLDRTLEAEEDKINRKIENINKKIALSIVIFAWIVGILILLSSGLVLSIALFVGLWPFIIGFFYSKGVKIGRFYLRLKHGLGVKNFVVALTWTSTILGLAYPWIKNSSQLISLFLFFFFKVFINTTIYDYKDIKGDAIAGIRTLPVFFGEEKTRILLYILHFILHSIIAIFIFLGSVKFDRLIWVYSWLVGTLYIGIYADSKKKRFRDIVVDGEFIQMAILRNLLPH